MKISIFVFCFRQTFIHFSTNKNEYYDILKDFKLNETIFPTYLIDSLNINSFFLCLPFCNSNQNCSTTVYQTSTRNCLLYSKHFQITELTNSIGSNVYIKKLKPAVSNLSVSTPSAVNTNLIVQTTVNVLSSSTVATNQSTTTQLTVVTTKSSTNSSILTIVITYNVIELNARLLNGM